jgi:hypothetical protein
MASSERNISVAAPAGPGQPSGVEARIASLEDEAGRLRAEVVALQDELRWLTDDEADGVGEPALLSRGLLARGWLRASLLLTVVGAVALVSVPYFLHLLDGSSGRPSDPLSPSAVHSTAAAEPVAPPAIPVRAAARPEYVPAPVRERATPLPEPARVRPAGRRAAVGEPSEARHPGAADDVAVVQGTAGPVRGESP